MQTRNAFIGVGSADPSREGTREAIRTFEIDDNFGQVLIMQISTIITDITKLFQ